MGNITINTYRINKHRFDNVNALVLAIFLFQYGLFIPFNAVLGGQLLTVVFTLIATSYAIIFRQIRFNVYIIFLLLFPALILFLKFPFEYHIEGGEILLEMLFSFFTIGYSGILLGTLSFNYYRFVKYCYIIAWLNFGLILYIPFTGMYGEVVNYMRLGYALLPIVLVSLYIWLNSRNPLSFILFSLSFLELLFFGARGSLLILLLFSVTYFLFISDLTRQVKLSFLYAFSFVIFIFTSLLDEIVNFYYLLDIDSYLINKLLFLYEGKSLADSSSGRDEIWSLALVRFADSPIIGSPINFSFFDIGASYYHNVFIDVAVNFGVFGLLIFLLFILVLLYFGFKSSSKVDKFIILILLLIPFGRLLVSSSFWQRPEFWLFISFSITRIYFKKMSLNIPRYI